MKTTNNTKLSLHFLIALTMTFSLVFFSACNKTDTKIDLTEEEALLEVQDETLAAELFDEIAEIGDEAIFVTEINTKSTLATVPVRLNQCATITREFVDNSIVVTINFGDENCEGPDGKLRRGKIIITRSGRYWDGAVRVVYTFDNFFVNDNQLLGTKEFTGYINDDGNRASSMIIDGSIILADDAGTITWKSERHRVVIEGSDTRIKSDDRIEITGFSNGVNAAGETFSSEIIEPLVRIYQDGCFRFYVAGIVKILKANGTEVVINYGDGTCDNLAEVTIDGVTQIIELGTRRVVNN
ncbi:MAG: hypothetical protein V1783_02125 [Bacteroidota bacterium]